MHLAFVLFPKVTNVLIWIFIRFIEMISNISNKQNHGGFDTDLIVCPIRKGGTDIMNHDEGTTLLKGMVCDSNKIFLWHKSEDIKGTISDNLSLRKIFKPFRNKEKYLSITTYTIFLKQSHKFDRKTTFHQISFRGPWALFLSRGKLGNGERRGMANTSFPAKVEKRAQWK